MMTDGPRPEAMVVRLAARRTWKGAAAVAAANVLVTVTAVLGYVAAYPNPADRVTLAQSIGSNPGLSALFGETRALETVAGFTEWRVLLVLALVGGVWGLFTTTRILRGEEDTGRAEVLLAAPITRPGLTRAALLGAAASLGLLLAATVAGFVLGTGGDVGIGRAALLAAAIVAVPAVTAGVGAVTSQLMDTRRRALSLGAGVLGAWYLLRVVADSSPDLHWLRWATPLGWLELASPLTDPNPWPVVMSYGLAAALAVLAVGLVRSRDVGAGRWGGRDGGRARTALLASPLGLAVRLAQGPAVSWALGLAAFGALIGLVARTAADAMAKSTGGELLGQLGIDGTGTRAYVGVSYVLVTLALATAAAGQVAATRDEEASSRLDNLLVRPVGRGRWILGRLVVASGLLALASSAAVLGTWLTSRIGDLGVDVGDLAVAGVNALPAAVFVLGAGTLLHALLPRLAVSLTYTLVTASFLLEIVGAAVNLPTWLLNLSVLHHVAPAPAADPDWRSAGALVLLGVGLALLGMAVFRRRDVELA